MAAYFKAQATAQDLRDVQSNVAWEWAVATGLPLPEAAKKFCREYRSFWPLTQLGDPLRADDRMFSIDEREVLVILRKLEEKYGKYDTGSSTDISVNIFQRVNYPHVAQGPVWVRNTRGPRQHVEAILRKYGVPYLPSHAPGIRMAAFFCHRSLLAKPEEASPQERQAVPTVKKYAVEPPIIAGYGGRRPTTSPNFRDTFSSPGITFTNPSPPRSPITPTGSPTPRTGMAGSPTGSKMSLASPPLSPDAPLHPSVRRPLF